MRHILLLIIGVVFAGIPAYAQWHVTPAVVQDQIIVHELEYEINSLLLYGDQILLGGDFTDLPGIQSMDLALFDGTQYLEFDPPLSTVSGNNRVLQLIDDPNGLIAVGRLPAYGGVAQLIDSTWVSIGIVGANNIKRLFKLNENYVLLKQGIIYQRIDNDWTAIPPPSNVEFDDISTFNNTLYAIGNDSLWSHNGQNWETIEIMDFVPLELSQAQNHLFCAGVVTENDTTNSVVYYIIEGQTAQIFDFDFQSPLIIGSVIYDDGDWIITNAKDHAIIGSIPTRMITADMCETEPLYDAPVQIMELGNEKFAAMNGLKYVGLFQIDDLVQCDFIGNGIIQAYVHPNPTIFDIPNLNSAGLLLQQPDSSKVATIYSSAIWMSGISEEDTTVTADMFGQIANQFFGPVADALTVEYYRKYGRTFEVHRSQIDTHINSYTNPFYEMPEVIANWPAHGDPDNGEALDLAPFVDVNNNGHYEPELGDYPEIKGDVCVFYILNDCRSKVYSNEDEADLFGDSLGIEDHVMVYLFEDGPEQLLSTVFVEHTLINRSDRNYSEFKCGIWNDFDIGNANDDYVGCDSVRHCFFGYNGDSIDEQSSTSYGFGNLPNSAGCVVLNQTMDHALYYNIGSNPINGDPRTWKHIYNYLHGTWKQDSPLLFGGNGVSGSGVTSGHANYMFPSDPASDNPSVWNEISSGNPPGDRRMLGTVAPIALASGESYCLHYAIVHGNPLVPSDTAQFESVHRMLTNVDWIQDYYDDHLNTCLRQELNFAEGNGTEEGSWFDVYPNPGHDYISLSLPYTNQTYNLLVFDAIGRLVFDTSFVANDPFQAISTSKWANGMYVVQLSGNGLLEQRKWLKAASK